MKPAFEQAVVLKPSTLMEKWRNTLSLWAFSGWKIPMIFFTRPRVVVLDDRSVEIAIPLTRKTKNHLGSMYFAAMATGADCAIGLLGFHHMRKSGKKISLIFKDFKADYHQRAEGETHFICTEGATVEKYVKLAIASGERQTFPVHAIATVPNKMGAEPVASFILTMSLKVSTSQ